MIQYLILAAVLVCILVYLLLQKPKDEKPFGHAYILDDSNFARDTIRGKVRDERIDNWCFRHRRGHSIVAFPRETCIKLNPTMPPGGTAGLYYSLCFQAVKWEYQLAKADEWIEVSPVHKVYYEMTQKQKEELEARIKSGLASAAQAVADLELLKHDKRKYREFLEYFGLEYNERKKDFDAAKDKKDEHSLRAVFIDMVDVHTGEGISMRSIVSRWPTIIVDFQKMTDEDNDVDKVKEKLNVSKAEAVVLVTKNKLYQQWKRLFEPEIKARYKRIDELVKSREKSVTEYREWLKPIIARHKLIEEGLATPSGRSMMRTSFIPTSGQATSMARIVLWIWRDLKLVEMKKGGQERLAIEMGEGKVNPCDKWTKKNLIFHPKEGLIVKYPWITDEWVEKKKDEIFNVDVWIPYPERLYYSFIIVTIDRLNLRLASGEEIEDCVYNMNGCLMSQNVMFVKLLELKARQEELNRYVDGLIGFPMPEPTEEEKKGMEKKHRIKKRLQPIENFFDYFEMPLQFFKRGPYERDFYDRISQFWCRRVNQLRFVPLVNFIKSKMGVGT